MVLFSTFLLNPQLYSYLILLTWLTDQTRKKETEEFY
jgi:hypothetical protein